MIYDASPRGYGDGMWHCPFPPEWVERMARAAKHCKRLTAEHTEASDNADAYSYKLPPGEFMSEPQDARGLPLSYCDEEERRYSGHPTCCMAVYDYGSIPEVVITDGEEDWPLCLHGLVLTA